MRGHLSRIYSVIAFLLVIFSILFLTGCEEKAKLIQTAANQYSNDADIAIDKLDALLKRETEFKPIKDEESFKLWFDFIKNPDLEISESHVAIIAKPQQFSDTTATQRRNKLINDLRSQYLAVALMVKSLDKGYWLSASSVKKMIPILQKLNAQMLSIAKAVESMRLENIEEKALIFIEFGQLRDAYLKAKNDTNDNKYANLLVDPKIIEAVKKYYSFKSISEKQKKELIAQALKVATLGNELVDLAKKYDEITFDEIVHGINYALNLAGQFPGLDISELKSKTNTLTDKIISDPELKKLSDTTISHIRNVI